MIINMTGGAGASGCELIVHAPTGSTVVCTKDGKTKTAQENSGVWTFAGLDYGTWTITATQGSSVASKDVTIERDAVTLTYEVYIYLAGQTSGFNAKAIKYSANNGPVAPTITYGDSAMTLKLATSYNYRSGIVVSDETWDFSEYKTLSFSGSGTADFRAAGTLRLCIWTAIGSTIEENLVYTVNLSDSLVVDLVSEGLDGSYFVGFGMGRDSASTKSFDVTGIVLE